MWSPSRLPGCTALGFMETSQPEMIRPEGRESGELMAGCLVFLWCGGRSPGSGYRPAPLFLSASAFWSIKRARWFLSFSQDYGADEIR